MKFDSKKFCLFLVASNLCIVSSSEIKTTSNITDILNTNIILNKQTAGAIPSDELLKGDYLLNQSYIALLNLLTEKHINQWWESNPTPLPSDIPETYKIQTYDTWGKYNKDPNIQYESVNSKNNMFKPGHQSFHDNIVEFINSIYTFLSLGFNYNNPNTVKVSTKATTISGNNYNLNFLEYNDLPGPAENKLDASNAFNNVFTLLLLLIEDISSQVFKSSVEIPADTNISLDLFNNLGFLDRGNEINTALAGLLNQYLQLLFGFKVTNTSGNAYQFIKFVNNKIVFSSPFKLTPLAKEDYKTVFSDLAIEKQLYIIFANMLEPNDYVFMTGEWKSLYMQDQYSHSIFYNYDKISSREELINHIPIGNNSALDLFKSDSILPYDYWNQFSKEYGMDLFTEFLLKINKISFNSWANRFKDEKYLFEINDEFWAYNVECFINPDNMYNRPLPHNEKRLSIYEIIAIAVGTTVMAGLIVLLSIYVWKNTKSSNLTPKKYSNKKRKGSGFTES